MSLCWISLLTEFYWYSLTTKMWQRSEWGGRLKMGSALVLVSAAAITFDQDCRNSINLDAIYYLTHFCAACWLSVLSNRTQMISLKQCGFITCTLNPLMLLLLGLSCYKNAWHFAVYSGLYMLTPYPRKLVMTKFRIVQSGFSVYSFEIWTRSPVLLTRIQLHWQTPNGGQGASFNYNILKNKPSNSQTIQFWMRTFSTNGGSCVQ